MSAIYGTFASIKTMADGTPRITLDLGCTLAEIAALGLMPGAAFGLARITGASTIAPIVEKTESARPGDLCIMACNFCKDPNFQKFTAYNFGLSDSDEADCKQFILDECEIKSRKILDLDPHAADVFHKNIRLPFLKWKMTK